MLPADELARLQADITALLGDTCDVYSNDPTPDGFGGIVSDWAILFANVPCRLDQKAGREAVAGGAIRWVASYTISMPATYTVSTDMRVLHNEVWYSVASVNAGSYLGVTRVKLERMAQ
jgi:hypothetical protein